MRISIRNIDPGYANWSTSLCCMVYLDGVKIKDCVTADEELGKVWIVVRDEDGTIVVEGNEIKLKELNGKVRIKKVEY